MQQVTEDVNRVEEALLFSRSQVCCLRVVAALSLLLVSCGLLAPLRPTPSPRPEPIALLDLLIDRSVFPAGWRSDAKPESLSRSFPRSEESLGIWLRIRSINSVASHYIVRYRDAFDAAYEYEEEHGREFGLALILTPWAAPAGLSYESTIADQFRFACATSEGFSRSYPPFYECVAVGRYEEFVSVFSTVVDPDHMTYTDLRRILTIIDKRMARYVKGE